MSPPHLAPIDGGDDPPGADAWNRPVRAPRTNLYLAATLSAAGARPREVRVRNLSIAGARVECSDPPRRGSTVLLCRGSNEVAAEVAWVDEGCCGLRFAGPIDVPRWISDRPGGARVVAAAEPSLADDLVLARRLLARLEDGLAEHPHLVAVLGRELQSLDLAAQLLQAAERRATGSIAPGVRGVRQAAATLLAQPLQRRPA